MAPTDMITVTHNGGSDSLSQTGSGDASWVKNKTKIYFCVGRPRTPGSKRNYNYGFFIEPKKESGFRNMFKSLPEKTLYLVENGSLRVQRGEGVGLAGLVARFLIGRGEYNEQFESIKKVIVDCAAIECRPKIAWALSAVEQLQDEGFSPEFDVDDFEETIAKVLRQKEAALRNNKSIYIYPTVTTVDYLDHVAKTEGIRS